MSVASARVLELAIICTACSGGGRDLGGVLGIGGTSGFSAGGSASFVDTISSRGEAGVPTTDFGPWVGSVTFDTSASTIWHFGETTSGLEWNESDFLSVAEHELAHSLGFGTSSSWANFVSGSSFTGPASAAQFGGNVPLSADQGHWDDGTADPLTGQETAMDPIITSGTRKLFTELDFAGLDDLGWDVRSTNLFVVNSVGDGGDSNPGNGLCDDGSGNCTLRAAIEEANTRTNLPGGADVINFDISGVGPHTIQPGSALPTVPETVVIDGTTEPDFVGAPVVEIDGDLAGAGVNGLYLDGAASAGSTIRGLAINSFDSAAIRFDKTSGGHTVAGTVLGLDVDGSTVAGNRFGLHVSSANNTIEGNVISGNNRGILLKGGGSTGNTVRANLIGTNAGGNASRGNTTDGVKIRGGSGNTIGGPTEADGNTISANGEHGIFVERTDATGNIIEGNNIGTNVAGTAALGNTSHGIQIADGVGNRIGGTAAGAGNVIGGNHRSGIVVTGGSVTIQGNFIGTDRATQTVDLGNASDGVNVNGGLATIGGTVAGAGNFIAHNGINGVRIISGTGNAIQGNSIFSNVALGIDLKPPNGPTANDPDTGSGADADTGANNLQNFPEMTAAILNGANLDITYSVPSAPANSAYDLMVEFFIADGSGAEGQTYLGSHSYTAPGTTTASIPQGSAVAGSLIVATATDATGNTSEFSASETVASPLLAAGGEQNPESGVQSGALGEDQLAPIFAAAIDRLVGAGFAADLFSNVQVSIADLPGATLGLATDNTITIDVNAAGYGWSVSPEQGDESPEPGDSDSMSGSRLSSADSRLRMDLLTVVMHELGHTAGLEDLYDAEAQDDLMYGWRQPRERRTDTAAVDSVFADRQWS